jgi:hypothetical protein
MAVARWRQMRTWSIQKNDFDREIHKHQSTATTPITAPVAAAIAYRSLNDAGNSLSNAIRNETAFERQFNRAIRELKFLKANCGGHVVSFGVPSSSASTWDTESETFDDQSPEKKEKFRFEPSPTNEHLQRPSCRARVRYKSDLPNHC